MNTEFGKDVLASRKKKPQEECKSTEIEIKYSSFVIFIPGWNIPFLLVVQHPNVPFQSCWDGMPDQSHIRFCEVLDFLKWTQITQKIKRFIYF